ncbi:FixH family protein [Saccharomonospora sp. NPDC046836]|uniref:FixH family protein n=1 Tax=Saccharomonospora sp. NPDC046836 TaxID=3156921 RepID=UPI0033EA3FCC
MTTQQRIPRARIVLSAVVAAVAIGALLVFWLQPSTTDQDIVHSAATERHQVRLTIEHTGIESGEWLLEITTDGTDPAAVDHVLVEPAMPSMGHALTPLTATAEGAGRFRVRDVTLPMRGQWEITVTIAALGTEDRVVFPLLVTG